MVFFIVIAALVAVTTFVQRSLQGRIQDAKSFMIASVNDACDDHCRAATGNTILNEYEPYYARQFSNVQRNEEDNQGQTRGDKQGTGSIYYQWDKSTTNVISNSIQLPPQCANGGC